MSRHAYLTHPQVKIDPAVPVPDWGLSEVGAARMRVLCASPWIARFGRIVSSEEVKAREAAAMVAAALGLSFEVRAGMHENDRSATGFLPPPEFEATADAFFAAPDVSIRGWEKARDAQARIVAAVRAALAQAPETPTLFVGHGGVGTLLKCAVSGRAIARIEDQLPNGGGNHYAFTLQPDALLHEWTALENSPPV